MKNDERKGGLGRTVPELRAQPADDAKTLIFVALDTSWDSTEEVREFVEKRCKRAFLPSTAERAILASDELLDWASRYGSVATRSTYELRTADEGFEVRVCFATLAARLPMLREKVEQISVMTPQDALAAGVKDVAKGSADQTTLGLARMRSEDLEVQLDIDRGMVSLTARASALRRLRG